MPLVRIDLVQGKSAEYRRAIGGVVYEAMVDVLKAPKDVSGALKIASLFDRRSTSVEPLCKKRIFTRLQRTLSIRDWSFAPRTYLSIS